MARTAIGMASLLLAGPVLATTLGARASGAVRTAAHAGTLRGKHDPLDLRHLVVTGGPARLARRGACPMAVSSGGYVNPLAGATVRPERIDQGVDYAGSGTLTAIGTGRVTYMATEGTGWPGAFVEYRLLTGADAGCYVFYAEGVTPEPRLKVGDTLTAGEAVATIIPHYPTGVEIGWSAGAGTKTYAALTGRWTAADDQNNVASRPGRKFSALIALLGGPPGHVEG